MRRKLMLGLMIVLVAALFILPVSAANPHPPDTSGQPSQSCQALFGNNGPFTPDAFNKDGFNFATTRYAGSGFTANGNNPKAVSQYDVACFQQYQRLFG